MARVALTLGAYTDRSIIANCQRCLNLFPRANPEGHPVPFTFYPTPGLARLATPTAGAGRGLWRASNGVLYGVVGQTFYKIGADWSHTALGVLTATATTPVSMSDNGVTLVLVDGSPYGYTVGLYTDVFAPIVSAAFYGSDMVFFLDTFFVFNKPGTGIFYSSLALSITLDPLYFATKIGFSDKLVAAPIVHREIWLIGEETTEIWVNSGGAAFPFELMTGAFIENGCSAKYSIAKQGDSLFWLSRSLQGQNVVLKGANYQAQRISTHAIETAIAGYAMISDAVGFTYQQEGHKFYVLSFPTANKTWVYDETCNLWHERAYIDANGVENRHRSANAAFVYGVNVAQDWETGALYRVDLDVYTDDGNPIPRRRGFPHMGNDGSRVFYRQFLVDMEVGTALGTGESPKVDPEYLATETGAILATEGDAWFITSYGVEQDIPAPPQVWLRWSDTRGKSWSNPISSDLGGEGDYLESIQFQRLGMARDRVFEVFWSANCKTALSGAFVNATPGRS